LDKIAVLAHAEGMTTTPHQLASPGTDGQTRPRIHHSIGFWVVAVAFLLNMAFSAVPTPLYVLYQQRDGFSNLMVTVVFAVYAVGVIGSLFLGGHLSDWVGRRRVFVPALLANAASAVVFIVDPSLAGLIVARVISGVSVGLTTATATSYLAELHASARPSASQRRAEAVATGSNLGGIGFGPLAAGLLAQFAPAPFDVPYVVFGVALVGAAVAVALSPRRPSGARTHGRGIAPSTSRCRSGHVRCSMPPRWPAWPLSPCSASSTPLSRASSPERCTRARTRSPAPFRSPHSPEARPHRSSGRARPRPCF
jgi:MFS family permease